MEPVGTVNAAHASFSSGRAFGKKLSSVNVRKMMAEASEGATASSLGKKYGVSGTAVCHIAKQFGIRFKKGRPKL